MSGWKQAFDAINMALGVIAGAGAIPGVNLIPYVATVAAAASTIKAGMNAGVAVLPYIVAIKDTFTGGLPTPEQLADLDAKIAELRAVVEAELPPKEAGEPD